MYGCIVQATWHFQQEGVTSKSAMLQLSLTFQPAYCHSAQMCHLEKPINTGHNSI